MPPVLRHPFLWFCVLCLGGFSGCRKAETPGAPPPPEVRVVTVGRRDVPLFQEWLGTLNGLINSQVRARVTGYLIAQNYCEGDYVKEGQLLFTIDPRPLEAALAQARGDLARAQATEKLNCANNVRAQALYRTGVISAQERDTTSANYGTARADVLAQEAAVETARLNVEFSRITAPVSGIAGVATAQLGDLVGPNTTGTAPLTMVSTVDPIKTEFTLSEQEYLGFIRRQKEGSVGRKLEGGDLRMILADGWEYPHKGRFEFTDRSVDPNTGSIRVYALFANPGNRLRPGLFCRVRAQTGELKGATVVPRQALMEVQGTFVVIVVTGEGKATFRTVELGETDGPWRVVRKGVKPGERIVIDGLQKARDGQPVRAVESKAEAKGEP